MFDGTIFLERTDMNEVGAFGHLTLIVGEKVFKCVTVERPWLNNEPRISCIPAGHYVLKKRKSPIVKRTSGLEEGWEVTNVPNRTFIMIHPANLSRQLMGCIAVGRKFGKLENTKAVLSSKVTFLEFMKITDGCKTLKLIISEK